MKSLSDNHHIWFSNFQQFEYYSCRNGENNCGIYHVMSPILHDIGIFSSYGSYDTLILKITSDIFYSLSCPNILVVGVDSESSARSLINALRVFRGKYFITFLDCCKTPLNRIKDCIENPEEEHIFVKHLNIFDKMASPLFGKFDIVFADSFVKQFVSKEKNLALKVMAKFLKSEGSILIVREYIDTSNRIIKLNREKLIHLLRHNLPVFGSSKKLLEQFVTMALKFENNYTSVGELYSTSDEFKSDLVCANLVLKLEFNNKWRGDTIFVVQKNMA